MRRLLGRAGEVLVTLGALLLLFVAWQLWWTDVVSDRAAAQVVHSLEQRFQDGTDRRGASSGTEESAADPLPGGAFAVIRIPALGGDWVRPVVAGTGADQLKIGVGHYTGTADPGQVGNFAVAGHRTTYGRPFHDIDRLVAGDRVVVETADDVDVYEVTSHEVVRPWQTEVIAPVPDEPGTTPDTAMLTITTCHPRYQATYRYVVHGRLLARVPRADWRPQDWAGGAVPGGVPTVSPAPGPTKG